MSLINLVRSSFYDDREFEFGTIWTIPDEIVSIPDADRDGSRVEHRYRSVLIASNNQTNNDPLTPVISVILLSHRVDCLRYGDVELTQERDGVAVDSIVRVRLLQPVLKADLVKQVVRISNDASEEILLMIEEYFGLSFDD